ncbi:MAG TPA: hypothetical protein VNV37_01055 [Solirubrobacteraceae bacterium]|jgi:hypothetical protein|nr:hypothetical protein [Solirubrobacteraceae bacterium]
MSSAEVATLDDIEQPERTTAADLDKLRDELRTALRDAAPIRIKTVLQALIDGIRVNGRDCIEPIFHVPAVREPCGSMEPADLKSSRSAQLLGGRMSLDGSA